MKRGLSPAPKPPHAPMWARVRAAVGRLRAWWRRLRGRTIISCAMCLPAGMCVDHLDMVRAAGMTPMKPPNPLMGPGAMVWVRERGPNMGFIEVGSVCAVRGSLGSGFAPRVGPTQRSRISRAAEKRFAIGADVLSRLKVDVQFKHIRSVGVAFENPRIMLVDEEAVLANMQNRSKECRDMIRYRLDAGYEVTMITHTLEADLIYSVEWELATDLDVGAQVEVLTSLAAHFGLGGSIVTSTSISSNALIWGIIDDLFLARLSINVSEARQLGRTSTRLLDPDRAIDLNLNPDAPLVPSTNPANSHYNVR